MSALDDLKTAIGSAINNSKPVDGIDPDTIADQIKSVADFAATNPGPTGAPGGPGPQGPAGAGVPNGGTTGQALVKTSNANGAVGWSSITGGSAIEFNAQSYGAIGDGLTNDTVAIQAAITAAHAVSGKVIIPQGIYLIDQLNWFPNVEIAGVGLMGSILKSNSAVPMFYYHNNVSVDQPSASFKDLYLNGNGIGTIGIDIKGVYHTSFSRLVLTGFTAQCVKLTACVADTFNTCEFLSSPYGVTLNYDSTLLQSNLTVFNECDFIGLTTWGILMDKAAGLMINNCDFETNGTPGNLTTGCVNLTNNAPYSEGVVMSMNNTWFERNNGTEILIGAQLSPSMSGSGFQVNISNTILQYPNNTPGGVNTPVQGIVVNGGNLNMYNTTVGGHTLSAVNYGVITNNTSVTTVFGCVIDGNIENNSGKFIAIDLSRYANLDTPEPNYAPAQVGGIKLSGFMKAPRGIFETSVYAGDATVDGWLYLKRAGNSGMLGTATLVNGTVTLTGVIAANLTANSQVFISRKKVSGTPGFIDYDLPGANFLVINSTSNTDNSIVNWVIFP